MGRRESSDLVGNPFIDGVSIKGQPCVRRYIQRLYVFWKEKDLFEVGEQRLRDQVQMIQKKV